LPQHLRENAGAMADYIKMPLLLFPNCQRTNTGHILPACLLGTCPSRFAADQPARTNRSGSTDVSQNRRPQSENLIVQRKPQIYHHLGVMPRGVRKDFSSHSQPTRQYVWGGDCQRSSKLFFLHKVAPILDHYGTSHPFCSINRRPQIATYPLSPASKNHQHVDANEKNEKWCDTSTPLSKAAMLNVWWRPRP